MRTSRIVLLAIGLVVLVTAAIWRPVVVPQMTKLPTSLNQSVQFAGAYTGYINQATGARLAVPQNLPLSIDRHVKAVANQSTSAALVVDDVSQTAIGPQKSTGVLRYVLDRSTSKNVKSPRAYALVPGNVVDRSGSYTLGPPPGLDTSRTYPFWIDEAGKAIPLTYQHATQAVHGVSVQRWQMSLPATPMVASMVTAMGLPKALPFASFAAEAKGYGIDLTAAFRALSPSLTAAQKAALAALTAAPISLQYLYAFNSTLLVEPSTGATADVVTLTRAYSVRPNLGPLATGLAPILAAHPASPVAARLAVITRQLAGAPAQPLYTMTFHQTPASVVDTAGTAGHSANLLNVLTVWIPVGLGVVGLLLVGLSFTGRRRAGPSVGELPQPGRPKAGV